MERPSAIGTVKITFFSGTGGTRRVAEAFERELIKRGIAVDVSDLSSGKLSSEKVDSSLHAQREPDLYLLVFPVYAFDAPMPVVHWIRELGAEAREKKAAVISVSGGGEVWPNTGCRNRSCKELEEKGLHIIYDGMMCMPANMLVSVDDHLAMRLIQAIPEKVNSVLDDVLNGRVNRTRYHKDPLRKWITKMENGGSGRFTESLTITDDCKSCGWCARNCPMENIEIAEQGGKPRFADRCTICLRCVYGCPCHAIQSKLTVVFRHGFDLDAVEERMEGMELAPLEECCKGMMLSGVKKYLAKRP